MIFGCPDLCIRPPVGLSARALPWARAPSHQDTGVQSWIPLQGRGDLRCLLPVDSYSPQHSRRAVRLHRTRHDPARQLPEV
eukprot:s1221_g6.t2